VNDVIIGFNPALVNDFKGISDAAREGDVVGLSIAWLKSSLFAPFFNNRTRHSRKANSLKRFGENTDARA
jgi:hypothetical protein